MHEFRVKPKAINEIRKKLILRRIPILIIAIVAVVLITQSGWEQDNVLYIIIPAVIVFFVVGLLSAFNKLKKILESFRITIEGNVITREQLNTEELQIYFHEIKEITKTKAGSLIIKGFDKTDIIGIPPGIENQDILEALLNEIMPITPRSVSAIRKQQLSILLSLVAIVLMVTVYMATNKIVVGVSAILVVAAIIWSIFWILKSKNVDNKAKGRVWIYFILIASILISAVLKIFAD